MTKLVEFWSFVKALVKLTKMAEELIKILFFLMKGVEKRTLQIKEG